MKHIFAAAIAAAALLPAAAQAQQATDFYAGVQGGYHDFEFGIDGAIFGAYAGVNVPVGEQFVVGVEGNANIGTNDVDAEYGVSAHAGVRVGNGLVFGRVGWQQVEFEGSFKDDDVLYGIGGEFGINERTGFRVVVDTIAFDTTRVTAGMTFRF